MEPTITELYESRFTKNTERQFKVSVKFKESVVPFGVILMGGDYRPDCKISSFAENIYFRTQKGTNYERYTTIRGLQRAIKNVAKKYGYTFDKLIIEKGEPDRI
jgi:hypothetical protein